ncbi:MAG: CPBP family intramembrane metalloprotease [Lachnospiraceae bacterium]|nr:CPBP family intramembrane metalloprotease [Lachnospiraceae bacterium]
MNKTNRRVNGFFLSILIISLGAPVLLSYLASGGVKMGTMMSLVLTQLLILVPSLVFLLIFKCDLSEWIPFKKLKTGTVLLIMLFTFLIMPFISLINVISQLFTVNEVIGISEGFTGISPVIVTLIVGFIGPFCEEFTFRGVIFGGLRRSGYVFAAAVISAIFFGLMHLNLNQMCYALVMGVLFSMLTEATGSIWAPIISHALLNTWNIVELYVTEAVYSKLGMDVFDLAEEAVDTDMKLGMIGVLAAVSAVTMLLAAGAYIGIYEHEGRKEEVSAMFCRPDVDPDDEEKGSRPLLTFGGYAGIAICVFVIFFLDKVVSFFKK